MLTDDDKPVVSKYTQRLHRERNNASNESNFSDEDHANARKLKLIVGQTYNAKNVWSNCNGCSISIKAEKIVGAADADSKKELDLLTEELGYIRKSMTMDGSLIWIKKFN